MQSIRLAVVLAAFFLTACATGLRTNMIRGLDFAEQAPRALIKMECNGVESINEGLAVCEQKVPSDLNIAVKIPPAPGRVVYSNGITKKETDDFNWRESGWIWKQKVIDTTWAELDLGKLESIYKDNPVALNVQALSGSGVINAFGAIYHRTCNDRDIPCSKLIVNYDCSTTIQNTYEGQIGKCVRMSGSSQSFSVPLKTLSYEITEGSEIHIRSGQSRIPMQRKVTKADIESGEVKFKYPTTFNGPDLFRIEAFVREQGIPVRYQTYVLIYGYSPGWTGIDKPHYFRVAHGHPEWCMPFTADLMEVSQGSKIEVVEGKKCIGWAYSEELVCAAAYDRESSDLTYRCKRGDKEASWIGSVLPLQ